MRQYRIVIEGNHVAEYSLVFSQSALEAARKAVNEFLMGYTVLQEGVCYPTRDSQTFGLESCLRFSTINADQTAARYVWVHEKIGV